MINNYQYKKICSASKSFLKLNSNNLVLTSIDQAHIIRPHPIFLKKYNILFESFFYLKILNTLIINFIKLLVHFIKNIFKEKSHIDIKKGSDYIFVSHFLNKKQIKAEKKNDYYFSHFLRTIKKKNTLVLFNHLNQNFIAKNKIILNSNENFKTEAKIFIKLINEFLKFRKNYINKKNKFERKFYILIYANIISINTFNNLKVYFQFKKITKKIQPKKIIVTFEGHAFERNIFLASKKINKKIKTIGFHHSIPFKNQFAYNLKLNNDSDPDIVMTSGKISYNKFLKQKSFNKVILIGSNRISNTATKFKNERLKKIKYCLVIPEGIESEANLLLRFCAKYLVNFDDIKFVIRLHPLLSMKRKKYRDLFKKVDIGNKVFFSNNKNQYDDIKKCDLTLYRGTSLIFDATKNGLVPFYYQRKNEINFDPLSISKNKNKKSILVSNIFEFNKAIKNKNIYKKNYYFEAYSYPNKKKILKYFK